jgi:hypothetical protein
MKIDKSGVAKGDGGVVEPMKETENTTVPTPVAISFGFDAREFDAPKPPVEESDITFYVGFCLGIGISIVFALLVAGIGLVWAAR